MNGSIRIAKRAHQPCLLFGASGAAAWASVGTVAMFAIWADDRGDNRVDSIIRNRNRFGSRDMKGQHDTGQLVRLPLQSPVDGAGSCRDYLARSETSSVVGCEENK